MPVAAGPETLSTVADDVPIPFFKSNPTPHLEQGDIIRRDAPVIQGALKEYHKYHVEHPGNEFFAVLTQSCDLIPYGGSCKARYISLAPVRTLRSIVAREFNDLLLQPPGDQFVFGSSITESRYQDFLAKLINNNDSRHFFIPARPQFDLAEDYCIMLPLSLPIKIEHRSACIEGRVAQLDDLFQAKLGWLLGQQYSRVGTPDWPEDDLNKKVQSLTQSALTWFPEGDFDQLKKLVREFEAQNPGEALTEDHLATLRKKIKNRKDLAIDTIFTLLEAHVPPVGKERFALRRKLTQDPAFSKFFPAS